MLTSAKNWSSFVVLMGYASTQMEVMSVSAPKDKNQTRTINVVKVSDVARGFRTVSSQFFIPPANISTFFFFFLVFRNWSTKRNNSGGFSFVWISLWKQCAQLKERDSSRKWHYWVLSNWPLWINSVFPFLRGTPENLAKVLTDE